MDGLLYLEELYFKLLSYNNGKSYKQPTEHSLNYLKLKK